MRSKIPSTPAEVLDLSSNILRLIINTMVKLAEVFKFWEYPYKKAATSFEEIRAMDIFYWVYKTTNSITRVEKGERAADLFMTDGSIIGLPQDFEKNSSITLGAAGDLLRSKGIEHSKDILFENVTDLLFDQAVSYANFESPITEQELKDEVIGDKEPPTECCSQEQFGILKGHKDKRFTVMNTANNHMFDMGIEGVDTTQRVFADEGIMDVGTNINPDEYGQGKIITKDGVKLGFVSVTFGLNGHELPDDESHRINVSKLLSKFADPELDLLKQQIDHCKNQGCDFIIASLHWGFEFEFFPRKRQVEAARAIVEYGADAIICHHPHVIQPVEYYRTSRDPNRIAVIAHSLGSMVWGFSAPHLVLSAILNLTLSKGSFQGKELTYIEKTSVTPVFRSYTDNDGKVMTRIEKLTDHLDGNSNHPHDYIAEIKQYADLVLGEYDLSDENLRDSVEAKSQKLAS
ncbi:MAG: CapA family protein [Alphaproteobacteria bacterium]|nr:CapA family protein [Alphaproteobacteria bacterium]